MIAPAQSKQVKTEQSRPKFAADSYIHDPQNGQPVRLPTKECIVIVLPAEPLADPESFRETKPGEDGKGGGNPYVTYVVRGAECPAENGGTYTFAPGAINLRTSFRKQQ